VSVAILKPDEIGDFLISTGAIRLLARQHGAENTVLVVKSEIAPLARREFPGATIVELPWQARQKGHNQTAANIRHCFPAWRRLCALRVDQSVCLRSQRDYLHTLLFAAPRVRQRFAPENVLLRNGRWRRHFAEKLLLVLARPHILPYPELRGDPTSELASHRAVVSAALGREVQVAEIMPSLESSTWRGGGGWLLCPFSSRAAKDYSTANWASVLREAVRAHSPRVIRVAGGPAQSTRLDEFVASLLAEGIGCPVQVEPAGPLENFADKVAAADLVLTVDTAAAHFACACRAPAVVVACGLHLGTYGPYSPDGRQIWLTGDWAARGRDGWQETVPPAAVAAAINRAMRL
jgi:ADP-heptose:LPS heptosyltransferase